MADAPAIVDAGAGTGSIAGSVSGMPFTTNELHGSFRAAFCPGGHEP